jgi:hypothetical protein
MSDDESDDASSTETDEPDATPTHETSRNSPEDFLPDLDPEDAANAFELNIPIENRISAPSSKPLPPITVSNMSSATIYGSKGRRVPVPQIEHYVNRGPQLQHLSLYEYVATIAIVETTTTEKQNDDADPSNSTSSKKRKLATQKMTTSLW